MIRVAVCSVGVPNVSIHNPIFASYHIPVRGTIHPSSHYWLSFFHLAVEFIQMGLETTPVPLHSAHLQVTVIVDSGVIFTQGSLSLIARCRAT
jgi:hypothetical protein